MSRRYFQFHLCALNFGASEWERLNAIVGYGCVEMGKQLWKKHSVAFREAMRETPSVAGCRSPLSDVQLQAVFGCNHLNVVIRNLEGIVAGHVKLDRFIKGFERRQGRDALVRIVTGWVFEARDRKGISYAELAVLAAIYSKIGAAKKPVRITRDEIWRRSLGYKSKRVFDSEMNNRTPSITQRQVRSIIDRLHSRNFFARITFARRQTFYSHRLTAEQLNESVFNRKMQPALARQARIRANDMLTQRIQAERRRLAGAGATADATGAAT